MICGFLRAEVHHELQRSSGTMPITASRTSLMAICRPKLCRMRAKNCGGDAFASAFSASPREYLQRLLELRAERGRVLGETAQLLEHLQPLRPELLLEIGVAEKAQQRIGLRALLRLAERLGGANERIDITGVAFHLRHPQRLERIEIFPVDQLRGIISKRQGRQPPAKRGRV